MGSGVTHPTQRLDNAVHQRTRLGILTVLAGTKRVKFVFLRNVLDLTDGNLSRNLTVLDNAGNITVEKEPDGRRSRTWISITPAGRQALAEEVSAPTRDRPGRRAGDLDRPPNASGQACGPLKPGPSVSGARRTPVSHCHDCRYAANQETNPHRTHPTPTVDPP